MPIPFQPEAKPSDVKPSDTRAAAPSLAAPYAEPASATLATPSSPSLGGDNITARERLVLAMMVLVATAAAAVIRLHFSASLSTAVLSGFAVWSLSMIGHLLAKRSNENSRMRLEIVRLEQEIARARNGIPGTGRATPANADQRYNKQSTSALSTSGGESSEPLKDASVAVAQTGGGAPAMRSPLAANGDFNYTHAPINIDARWEAAAQRIGAKPVVPAPAMGSAEPPRPLVREAAPQPQPAMHQAPAQSIGATPHSGRATSAPVQPQPGPQMRAPAGPHITDAPSWSGTSIATGDPMRDAWSFRPRDETDTRAFAPDAEFGAQPIRPIEADLELVQKKIKALADEVNAAELIKQQGARAAHGAANPIEDQISALRSTAGRMRRPTDPAFGDPFGQLETRPAASPQVKSPPAGPSTLPSLDALIPATAQPIAISAAPPASPAVEPLAPQATASPPSTATPRQAARPSPQHQRIQEIAAAIDSGHMDVFLQPIVGLGDYGVSHFEVAVRLRSPGGGYFERPEQILNIGATDILALFDIERLRRTAVVAEQLEARGKHGSILSSTSAQAMTDGGYFEAFAQTFEARPAIANQLVLSFAQADVASFSAGAWQALEDMRSFGFRFALEHVTHLGMDFADLAASGFEFMKLPAEAFLAGMAAEGTFIPAADICKHIAGAGLTLVVESVNDDETLARVFGFGALFGQGQLFGGARQISLETLGPKTAAA